MKSHDHHVMMQQILFMCMWNLLVRHVCQIIIILKKCFQKICVRVLNPVDIFTLKTYVVERLFMFEMWFPLSFFDVMTHLLVHLVGNLEIYGPLGARQCDPIKRYLHVMKRYMQKKKKKTRRQHG
jgi:hypothetical protein